MAASNDYLKKFEASMTKLNNVRRNVESVIKMKEDFTSSINDELNQINLKLQDLTNRIIALKSFADDLKKQVDGNKSLIGEKNNEMQGIQQNLEQLQKERDSIIAKSNEEKNLLHSSINEKQKKIDETEEQLRQLSANLQALTQQKDALDAELRGRGDQSQQHAEELKKMTEEHQAKLTEQQNELSSKINECESKIQEYEKKIKDNELVSNNSLQNIQSTNQQLTEQLNKVNQEKQELTELNNELIDKIGIATGAISEAADDLVALFNASPNAKTKVEADGILKQVNDSIQRISNALSGTLNNSPKIAEMTPIQLSQPGGNLTLTYQQIRERLNEKKRQSQTNPSVSPSYRLAFNEIVKDAQTPEDVSNIIKKYNIIFTAAGIKGGRKTKKNRNQKGGFTYKSTSRRRSISSTPKSNRRSRRSSR